MNAKVAEEIAEAILTDYEEEMGEFSSEQRREILCAWSNIAWRILNSYYDD